MRQCPSTQREEKRRYPHIKRREINSIEKYVCIVLSSFEVDKLIMLTDDVRQYGEKKGEGIPTCKEEKLKVQRSMYPL